MKRIALTLLAGAVVATALLSGPAAASGPPPPGEDTFEVQCEGVGSFTVSAPASEQGHGVAQIVGQNGHGIPVSSAFTLTDVSTETVLFSGTESKGGDQGNHNQTTTTCSGTDAEAAASAFFADHELPAGVSPEDIIRAFTETQVVIKLVAPKDARW
jgi:hypothetical protein